MKLLLFTLGNLRRYRRFRKSCRSPKISLVRILQWQVRWHELWVHNVSTVFRYRERDWRVL